MAKTFNHAVKYNGKYYPANTPIEEPAQKTEEPAQKTTKTRKKDDA